MLIAADSNSRRSDVQKGAQRYSCNTVRAVLFPALFVLAAAAPAPVSLPATAAVFAAGQDTIANNTAGRVEIEFTKALKKKGVALVDLATVFPPTAPASAEEGEKLFTTGREAYDNLDFDAAGTALSEAAVYFIKHPAAAKAEQLSEIFLFLGASELQNGAKPAAQKEFTRALQMNPALAPDTKYFGADVQAAVSAAQKEMSKRPKGTLSIESVPSGAEVEAFGLSYGMTPVSEIELPAGRYMVRLTRPGFAPSAAFPEVIGGQSTDVRQKLEASAGLMAARQQAEKLIGRQTFDTDAMPASAVEVATAMKGRFLVMLAVTSDAKMQPKVELQVWNANTGDRLTGVKFDVDADGRGYETGAEAVQAWIARPSAAIPVAQSAVQPSDGDSVFKKWWFWTAVGVVAVGGITAGAVAAQPPQDSGGFIVVLGQP